MQEGFRVGEWRVQPDVGTISCGEETRQLEPKIMAVLVYLAEHAGEVLSKERLLQAVWPDTFVTEYVLRRALLELRRAFRDSSREPRYIRTLPRRGFQLIAEVSFPEETVEDPNRYRLDRKLGEGGMGEVYLALDRGLDRRVALKFLRQEKESDEIWHRRLRREARAAAALDHPYICKVYDTGELEGRSFIAMEFVAGERLSQRLERDRIPVREGLQIALEMAEALEDAHRNGIVHRDIKPSNVILSKQGHIKITDFGIAKKFKKDLADEKDWTLTQAGKVVTGTPEYMSPEQIRGEPVDQRTDLFQFGVLLYEMLAGRHPFRKETPADTSSALLSEDPAPLSEHLEDGISPLLDHCIRKLLAKDLDQRYQSAHELGTDLGNILENPGTTGMARTHSQRSRWRLPLAAIALAVPTLFVSWLLFDRGPEDSLRQGGRQVFRTHIELPKQTQLSGGLDRPRVPSTVSQGREAFPIRREVVLSPRGDLLVFSAATTAQPNDVRLYQRPLDGARAEPIPGTEGGRQPFFSPDGQWIGFWADGKVKKIPIGGGLPTELAEVYLPPGGFFWTENGRILLDPLAGGLQWIPEDPGALQSLTEVDTTREMSHRLPWALPKSDTVLFTAMPHLSGVSARIEAFTISTGRRKLLLDDAADARYLPTGHLIFLRQGRLMAVPFDAEQLEVTGTAVPIQEGVQQALNHGLTIENSAAGQFWVSDTGTMVYASGGIWNPVPLELVWIDRKGRAERVEGFDKPLVSNSSLSPDGQHIAFVESGVSRALWIFDVVRMTHERLLSEGQAKCPVWRPDGKRVAVAWSAAGPLNVWTVPVDRTERRRRLTESRLTLRPSSWSPDGKYLACTNTRDILIYSFEDSTLEPFLATDSFEMFPRFSPDGHWLAYSSDETGQYEVYITSFPHRAQTVLISNKGGTHPFWSPAGTELFYRGPEDLMKVDISLGERISAGVPRPLFNHTILGLAWFAPVSGMSTDKEGKRFLSNRRKPDPDTAGRQPITRLNVTINWFEELNRLVPVD